MKKTFVLLFLFCVLGCSSLKINYTYKTNDRSPILPLSDIIENPTIGVALMSENCGNEITWIRSGFQEFIKHQTKEKMNLSDELLFLNIGPEILLDANLHISNIDKILGEHPQMRFAIVAWKSSPSVTKKEYPIPNQKSDNDKNTITWDSTKYETTISIRSELVLTDLYENKVLAKSIETLENSNVNIVSYEPKSYKDDFVSQLFYFVDLLSDHDNPPKPEVTYPEMNENSIDWRIHDFVYAFLMNLN